MVFYWMQHNKVHIFDLFVLVCFHELQKWFETDNVFCFCLLYFCLWGIILMEIKNE